MITSDLMFESSGSRGRPTQTIYDFKHSIYDRLSYMYLVLEGYEALDLPVMVCFPILPGAGPRRVLEYCKIRKPVLRWFSPVNEQDFKPSLRNRLGTRYIIYMSRLLGRQAASPEYLPLSRTNVAMEALAGIIAKHGGCLVHSYPSIAVRICQAANAKGVSLKGAKFNCTGEPLASTKKSEIESSGAQIIPRFASTEAGYLGVGCFNPEIADEEHFLSDHHAFIQREKTLGNTGISVNRLLITNLFATSPKVILNAETGDYGEISKRDCGCYWHKLGFEYHISNIRSFEKLTGAGMTFFGSNLIHIIENVLPHKFGGGMLDYQMVEEENDAGITHLNILVSPEIGKINEPLLVATVLSELSKRNDAQRMMATTWREADMLKVIRKKPGISGGGKLLPLNIIKKTRLF